MAAEVDSTALSARVASSMPQLTEDLARLVAIPRCRRRTIPEETRPALLEAHELILDLLQDAGVEELDSHRAARHRSVHHRRDPRARRARRPCSSTGTTTSCPRATSRSGSRRRSSRPSATARCSAAASADSKSNVIAHVGALRAWDGRPPVGIKLVIEGQEEVGSALNTYPQTHPEPVPLRRDADRGHGQRPAGGADAHRRAARHGDADDRGRDARRPEALGPVRRRRPGRADRAPARARLAPRRARRRHRRRAFAARSGPERRTARTSSASSPRCCPGCRSSAAAASARGSGRARRSPSPGSTCRRSTTR